MLGLSLLKRKLGQAVKIYYSKALTGKFLYLRVDFICNLDRVALANTLGMSVFYRKIDVVSTLALVVSNSLLTPFSLSSLQLSNQVHKQ